MGVVLAGIMCILDSCQKTVYHPRFNQNWSTEKLSGSTANSETVLILRVLISRPSCGLWTAVDQSPVDDVTESVLT